MTDVTLIQCTNAKRDEPAPAKDLYDESAYYNRMRKWAEARGDPWFILSAKHGLVDPDTVLDPYDQRGLSEAQAETIASQLNGYGFDTVHITAGMDYTDPVVPALEGRGIDVINHFAGERIGKRRQLLKTATAKLEHNTL